MLNQQEKELADAVFVTAARKGYDIKGFYHTSAYLPGWQNVIRQQLSLADGQRKLRQPTGTWSWERSQGASLLNHSTGLYLNVATSDAGDFGKVQRFVQSLKLDNEAKITFASHQTIPRKSYVKADERRRAELDRAPHLSEGEYSTIAQLHEYCSDKVASKRKALVYYFHTKSMSGYREFTPVPDRECSCCNAPRDFKVRACTCCNPTSSWRERMNAFTLEFPSICARAMLNHGYLACGIELVRTGGPKFYYAGNFWWADCDHIAKLGPTPSRYDAWVQEFLVLADSGNRRSKLDPNCGYSALNCGAKHYREGCPRAWYRDLLVRYASLAVNGTLPASRFDDPVWAESSTHPGTPPHNATRACRERLLQEGRYAEQLQGPARAARVAYAHKTKLSPKLSK